MSTFTWNLSTGGAYGTSGDWNQPGVPGATDDVILPGFGGTAYTVTTTANETANSLQTAANATLSITNSTYADTNGTGAGVNAGTISVGDGGTFSVGGGFNNSGAVTISSYYPATMVIANATTLSGGGQITLLEGGNAASNTVQGVSTSTTLTNVNNTIAGAGRLGNGQLTLINQTSGVIDATGSTHQLVLNTGASAVSNSGLIEATGAAGLLITGTTVNNAASGIIEANGSGVHVDLSSAIVTGGTLTTAAGGFIQTADTGSVLDGTTSTVTNAGMFDIGSGTSLSLKGTINNTGAFSVASYYAAKLIVATNTTLTGSGQVVLFDNGNATSNQLVGATGATTLTNVNNTISGAGLLGAGQLTIVNQAGGVINANGTSHQLTLNTGSATVSNGGLIEATGAAGLLILGTKVSNATGGKLLANNSVIDLQSADIIGGTLNTAGTGSFATTDTGSTLDGTASTNKLYLLGGLTIGSGTSLTIDGTINLTKKVGTVVTNGIITLNSYYGASLIAGSKNATLLGSQVDMLDGPNGASNQIAGTLTGGKAPKVSSLTNSSTIVGAGHIGTNLLLTNSATGVINATGSQNSLIIATGASNVAKSNIVKNSGLLESTNPNAATTVSGLVISNTVIANSGKAAIIQASGAATHVDLQTATIIGGTLNTLNGGVIQTVDKGSILDGSTLIAGVAAPVINKGTIVVADNGTTLSLKGLITNNGTISVTSYYASQLIMATNTTLSGGGAVTLNDGANAASNQLFGATAATSLTNVDNTISGAGQLGAGQLTLVNQAAGVINATGASNQLVISTGAVAVSNAGLIEATGTAGLRIASTTITNSGSGAIKALTGSHVDLVSATIAGGTGALVSTGTGYFQTIDKGSVLDGSSAAVNNQATILVANNGTTLSLKGTINNTGTISVTSYYASQLIMATNTTLTGNGAVILNDGANAASNQVFGATTATTLTNNSNTISGAGQLGAGQLTLINNAGGVIDATGTSNALIINTGAATVTNAGLIEAMGSAGLTISSAIANAGIIKANGGNVTLSGAVSGTGVDSIVGASVIEVAGSDSNTVSFDSASTGTLRLDQSQAFNGTVTGFSKNKTIDLSNVTIGAAHLSYSGNGTSGILTVTDGTTAATIKLTGNYSQANFALANDGAGHTDVTYNGTGLAATHLMVQAMAAMGDGSAGSMTQISGAMNTGAGAANLLALPHAA